MRGKIFYHGSCFDGASSAALFGDFYRNRHPGAELLHQPMVHSADDPFRGVSLEADDNICVDFRYCADPRMNWWFDHHVSAFQPRDLGEHFRSTPSETKFYDPTARSCAVVIVTALHDRFDHRYEGENWAELIRWADKIDGAQFADANEAVELAAPALRISTWLAHNSAAQQATRLIEQLGQKTLAEIAAQPWIREPLGPILENNARMIDLIAARAQESSGVVFYDLTADGIAIHNKFIAYMLFPNARYTVGLTCSRRETKVSVGFNPWAPSERTHNVAKICERYGGGGHPVVGAISLAANALTRAREVAREIVTELASA